MKAKRKKRTDADYVRLDDAVQAMLDWREEILDAMVTMGHEEVEFAAVVEAMRRVHSPEDYE